MTHVFLSYRHESPAHGAGVRNLATRLEQAGLDVILDQFAQERKFNMGGPNEGWPRWSKAQAGNPEHKVLIVGSPGWFRAYEQTEVPGAGLGAASEAGVIEQRLYNVGGVTGDIRMVSLTRLDDHAVPIDLQRYHRFVFPDDLQGLVQWLTGGAAPVQAVDEWPEAAPALTWVMADHEGVRNAFAELITRNPPFRYLPIRGVSGTGKSHITRQLLGNALRCTGLACGRFDFKGVADAGAELQRFVQELDVPAPPETAPLARQLDAVLAALVARKRPALVILDTFEAAASLERWVRDALLVSLVRQKWLRVVVAGQRVPERTDKPAWETEARNAIELTLPEPDHWYAFGKAYKPELTLDMVKTAYELARGNGALLSQLLGPEG